MSQATPTRLQRIERHLIRQRGAGVRSIAASFGFSIGLGSSTGVSSSDVDHLAVGPPAKRRKTIIEPSPIGQEKHDDEKSQEPTKKTKARRQIGLEQEVTVSTGGEDSFVFGQRKRKEKQPAVKSEPRTQLHQEIQPPAIDVTKQVAKGRPKRRAAATAAAKVADGHAEEAAPVDRKRRNGTPQKRATRTRNKNVDPLEETSKGDSYENIAVEDIEVEQVLPVAKQAGKNRKAAFTAVDQRDVTQMYGGLRSRMPDAELSKHDVMAKTQSRDHLAARSTRTVHAPKELDIKTATSDTLERSGTAGTSREARGQSVRTQRAVKRGEQQPDVRDDLLEDEVVSTAKATEHDVVSQLTDRDHKARLDNRSGPQHAQSEGRATFTNNPDGGTATHTALAADPAIKIRPDSRLQPSPPEWRAEKPHRRRPLLETDVNLTMSSILPNKAIPCPRPRVRQRDEDPLDAMPSSKRQGDKSLECRRLVSSNLQEMPHLSLIPREAFDSSIQGRGCGHDPIDITIAIAKTISDPSDPPSASNGACESYQNDAHNLVMTRIAMPAGRIERLSDRRRGVDSHRESQNSAFADPGCAVAETLMLASGQQPASTRKTKKVRAPKQAPKQVQAPEPRFGFSAGDKKVTGSEHEGRMIREADGRGEEDVDWLFDAAEAVRPPATTTQGKNMPKTKTACVSQSTEARIKVQEIDLDDLISNIASFAAKEQHAGSAGVESLSIVKPKTKRKR